MKNDFAVIREYAALIKEMALKMPAPNAFTPQLVQIAGELDQWAINKIVESPSELLQGEEG